MERREFLRMSGTVALGATCLQVLGTGAAAAASPKIDPLQVDLGGRKYRGTSDGKILVSSDAGKTWSVHSDFTSQYSVSSLAVSKTGTLATVLGFQGWPISLDCDMDQKSWLTVDASNGRRFRA